MDESFDPGALLGHSYSVAGDLRVRLRLARPSDTGAVAELLHRQGIDPDNLITARLVHFDPRRRLVMCATGLVGSSETLVGVGAIELAADGSAQPDTLIVDGEHRAPVAALLASALVGRASASARSRAA